MGKKKKDLKITKIEEILLYIGRRVLELFKLRNDSIHSFEVSSW